VKTKTIFVELINEGVPCWRPVEAEQLADGSFRLIGATPEDERWRFNPGDIVQCKQQTFQNGSGLVAYVRKA
jgi:hypothetical protein